MKNKKLIKYIVTSLGILSSLTSNGMVMASTDVLPTYIPASSQLSNDPLTTNNNPASEYNNSKQHSLPDNVLGKNSKKVPDLPSSIILTSLKTEQNRPTSNGSGISKILYLGLGVGVTLGARYAYNKFVANPTLNLDFPLDVHLFKLALLGSDYYRNTLCDNDTVNYEFGDYYDVPLSQDCLEKYEKVKYVFLALKDCLNKLLECNEFKQLSFEVEDESKKDFKRENAILESFYTFLGLSEITEGKWNCKEYFTNDNGNKVNYIAADMPEGTCTVSSAIQNDDGEQLRYNATFVMKNGKLSFDRLTNLSTD